MLKTQVQANTIDNFKYPFEETFNDKIIDRIDQNQGIFNRIMEQGDFSTVVFRQHYGAVLAGIPAAFRDQGKRQLKAFCTHTGFDGAVSDYRRITGEFNSVSAVATALA